MYRTSSGSRLRVWIDISDSKIRLLGVDDRVDVSVTVCAALNVSFDAPNEVLQYKRNMSSEETKTISNQTWF